MFTFRLNIAESCCESIEKLFPNNFETLCADIWLPQIDEKIGTLETFFNSSSVIKSNHDFSQFLMGKTVNKQLSKRKQPPNLSIVPKKFRNIAKVTPSPVVASAVDGSLLATTAPSAEAFISISQNLTTGEKSFQCSMCGHNSGQKGTVKRHIELKHLPKTTVLKCQLCDYSASLRFQLKSHYTGRHSLPEQAAKAMLD